jgi:type IV pilus assembly protein PilO
MKKFSDLPLWAQLGIFLILPIIIIGVAEFLYFPLAPAPSGSLQDWQTANEGQRKKVADLQAQNKKDQENEKKLVLIEAQNKESQTRLVELRSIVPFDKDVDGFIKGVRDAATSSGVVVRRFTPKPEASKEFYVELPLDIEFDGTFHSMLQFFNRVGTMSRIANVSNVSAGPLAGSVKGVQRKYTYAPGETLAASCVVTTFFQKEASAKAPAKK